MGHQLSRSPANRTGGSVGVNVEDWFPCVVASSWLGAIRTMQKLTMTCKLTPFCGKSIKLETNTRIGSIKYDSSENEDIMDPSIFLAVRSTHPIDWDNHNMQSLIKPVSLNYHRFPQLGRPKHSKKRQRISGGHHSMKQWPTMKG